MLSPPGQKERLVDVVLLRKEEKKEERDSQKEVERKGQRFQCFECKGFGYIESKCQNRKKRDLHNENWMDMKAKWRDRGSELTSGDVSSAQDNEENFMAFVGPLSFPPIGTSMSEVDRSPTTELDELD